MHTNTSTHIHSPTVLAQLLSQDGTYVTKERLEELIKACDLGPSEVNMETLFRQEPYCTVEYFEGWIKTHSSLASFSKWLLEESDTGFKLEGDPDPPTFYQTLAEQYGGGCNGVLQLVFSPSILPLDIGLFMLVYRWTLLYIPAYFCTLLDSLVYSCLHLDTHSHPEGCNGP